MRIRLTVAALLTVLFSALVTAQTFDTSANSTLNGVYNLRQLLFSDINVTTGAIGRSRSLIGTATLDGAGNYTFTGTLMDSQGGATPAAYTVTGTYKVSANGLAQMQNPIETKETICGGVGLGAFVGSSTETLFQDLLVMIPAGTATLTNTALKGDYRVGSLDVLGGAASSVRDAFFTLAATGDGNLSTIAANGSAANLGNTNFAQSIAGATYALSGVGSGTITFPFGGGTASGRLIAGSKTLYVSSDGNFLLGGSTSGYDIFIGIKANSGTAAPAILGTYYAAGFDLNSSSNVVDAFYGSTNGTAGGVNFWHQRLNATTSQTYDYTFATSVALDATGAQTKLLAHYDTGASSKAFLIVGRGPEYTLAFGLHADDFSGTGVFLNPLGIVNSASFSPVTNSVAPNESLTLTGSNLSAVTLSTLPPYQTTLGGVQVLVNGRFAPISSVSPQQITAILPFNTPEKWATVQVVNNGVTSNAVTLYANDTVPGVYTQDSSGAGAAAAFHSNFTLITPTNPAVTGGVIILYVDGLGAVTPPVADGTAASANSLNTTNKAVAVYIGGEKALVLFAGLAPGYAGLYQINVQVPAGVTSGTQLVTIATPDALHQQATISVFANSPGANATQGLEEAVRRVQAESAISGSYRPVPHRASSAKTPSHEGSRR